MNTNTPPLEDDGEIPLAELPAIIKSDWQRLEAYDRVSESLFELKAVFARKASV